ncbi:MAG: (Fe-S)-binding protein [Bacillota bacterium]|nr:(Fe-S)-binding protein [Bacillota bacterium]
MDETTKQKLLDVMKSKLNRQLLYYLDVCAKCGACKDACHIYRATGKAELVPSHRADLLRRLYRRHFTSAGRVFPSLYEATDLSDQLLDEMYQAAFTCTGCRRCMVYCPFGIDLTWVIGVEKAMLSAVGKVPEELNMLADAAIEKGNSIDLYREIMQDQIRSLEPELRELTGMPDATIPMGKKGARVLYVALAGTGSILPPAVIFNLAGEDWTLSEFEAANYGYFLGDTARAARIAERIVNEAKELGVEEVVLTECGHAYRVMKHLDEVWSKQKFPFKVLSVFEPWARYLKEGRVKVLRPIAEPATYHDPCQLGRNGGIYEEPREVVKAICTDFRDMTPNREKNWCCGGGGGLVAQTDLEEFRADTGLVKAEQVRATGARIAATPCENCRLQLALLNERYHLGVEVVAVTDLLVRAVAPGALRKPEQEPRETAREQEASA